MQERSGRTRRRLLEAAAAQIDACGYADAKLSDISRCAEVTTGALYFHFSSKTDLAEAVQRAGCAMLNETVDHLLARCSPMQALIDVTHVLARWVCEEPIVRASLRIGRERGRDGSAIVDFHAVCVRTGLRLLRDARATQGVIRADVSADSVEGLVTAVLSGAEADACRGMGPDRLATRLTGMWDLLVDALVVRDLRAGLRTGPPHAPLPHGRAHEAVTA
ncbi:ScbR family autoregulator-binding transcription factor [Streptomyces abikoensis]|uniref:ScbR family autoregulator-binding transcription factor n=1 Tax=Streptomyces abikoensis TaxID=97398 RepID=UPI003687A224